MVFADLKNDFVFRRIFAKHRTILIGLLNDLLDRQGEAAIVGITYLPAEQLPLVEGEYDAYERVMQEIQQTRELMVGAEARGRLAGKAEAVLAILSGRGIPVDDGSRERILAGAEGATLDLWISRALTATAVGEVLG